MSLQEQLLNHLNNIGDIADTSIWQPNTDHLAVESILRHLASHKMVDFTQHTKKIIVLTDEGRDIVEKGSHEARVYEAIPESGILLTELATKVGELSYKVGLAQLFKDKVVSKDKTTIKRLLPFTDKIRNILKEIKEDCSDQETIDLLKKRKLIDLAKKISYSVSKGSEFALQVKEYSTDLTSAMLQDNLWEQLNFKEYNLDATGIPPMSGHLHPVLKFREEMRQIFLEMGFEEMPTNNFVESSFWNFDALFQPQQHPARDAHDTFFLSEPQLSHNFPEDYLERVKTVHSKGGYGSIGYRYDWKKEEAQKNILRTHTTAVSARMLYALAQNKPFKPVKYFSIDRVFRNETLDATHLAEFHQLEGVIADKNLNLGHLIGVLEQFFSRLGMTDLELKPAYNPYTEPSMELFAYQNDRRMEVGNSGVFRPEMLLPMGIDPDVTVIAWGLSLERPCMIKYKIENIRDLVGHKVQVDNVKSNPICRLDKN